jgi:hypothetical protein
MNAKAWYKSNTIRMLLISIMAQVLHLSGIADDAAQEQANAFVASLLNFVAMAAPFVGIVADLFAAKFRASASGPLVKNEGVAEDVNNKQSGVSRLSMLALLATFAVVLALLTGCVTTPQKVISVACERTENYAIERCAKSVADVYETYQKRIHDVVSDATAPAELKVRLKKLDAAATPVMVELTKATATFVRVKQTVATGLTQEEKLVIANANLQRWIIDADRHVRAIIAALGG